ncbi:MAG: hypothetical protein IJA36_09160 [Lachnospiraceae bacterium]|nr:hypothetical protein [Lachnospiraceae bacterium]
MKKKRIQKILAVMLCAVMVGGSGHMTILAEQVSGTISEAAEIQMTEIMEESLKLPTGGVEIPIAEEETVTEETEEIAEFFQQQQIEYECTEPEVNGEYTNDYGYLSLQTAGARDCYNFIRNAACIFHENFGETTQRTSQSGGVNYIWNTVDISEYELERDEFRKVLFAIEADYPEFFWFNGDFSYNTTTVNGAEVVKKAYLRVEAEYAGVEERKSTQQTIEEGIKPYLEVIDKAKASGANDMTIELLLHDMIIEAVEYAYVEGTATPSDAAYAHSIVGVFDKMGVVCEGYSKAFQMLLSYAGIESIYAIGYGNGGGHAWNLVCLEGEWYNIDLTWDDVTKEKYDGVQYNFYNCNTASFGNHVYVSSVFPGMYEVPDTTADKYNYYKYYGLYVTSEIVQDEDSFLEFMKQVTKESSGRKDYLLQFGFDSAATQSTFREYLRNGKSNIEENCRDHESVFISKGTISAATNQWYSVYYPMVRIYADTYQADYDEQGAELEFHVVDGRKEVFKENNYTVTYTDNTKVGTAKAAVTGIGNYEYLGTNEFEFVISGEEITPTPEPTATPVPTLTPEPTTTPVPIENTIILHYKSIEGKAELWYREGSNSETEEWIRVSMESEGNGWYTYILKNKANAKLIFDTQGQQTKTLFIVSGEWWYSDEWYEYNPDNVEIPTVTLTPTKMPTETITPTMTVTPMITATPTPTFVPIVTVTPTPTFVPIVTVTPTPTFVPIVTVTPTPTFIPMVTVTPTFIPTVTVTPTPAYTTAPTITTMLVATDAPKSSVTPIVTKTPEKPGKVTGLKLKSSNASSIKITYGKQNNATGYRLVLYKGSKVVKSVETTGNTFTFKKLEPATVYKVKVCGYGEKGKEASYGTYSKTLKVATATKVPVIKSIKTGEKTAVISWKKVTGATGYEIYMSTKKSGTYKRVASLKKASTIKYKKKKLVSGKTYYFKIRTYKTVGGNKIYSSYSKIKSVRL